MRVLTLLLTTLLVFVPGGGAQEKDTPTGQPPNIWLASAFEQGGKVVIQIAKPEERGGTGARVGLEPGVKSLPAATVWEWSNLRKLTLGETVQAFRAKGERVEPKAVLAALAKPKVVGVFVRTKDTDPTRPDPVYLALLREDTLVLVVNEKEIYPEKP